MIQELVIKNVGLIRESVVSFKDNLNVITGESGVGKSFILISLSLLFQDRMNKSIVGEYDDKAYVKGIFEPNSSIYNILKENDIIINEDDFLVLEKTFFNNNRKTITKINHQIVTQELMKNLSPYLISFSMQNESSNFQSNEYIINILDSKFANIKQQYIEVYHKYQKLAKEIKELNDNRKEQENKLTYFTFQLEEIDKFSLKKEDFEIEELLKRVKNIETIKKYSTTSYTLSKEISNDLTILLENMRKLSEYDSNIHMGAIEDIVYNMESIVEDLRSSNMDFDDDYDINALQSRAFHLSDLMRKYGSTYEEIIAFKKELEENINNIEDFDSIIQKKRELLKKIQNEELIPLADDLHKKRIQTANEISKEVTKHIKDMKMENSNININVTKSEKYNINGCSNIEITLSHLNKKPQNLFKIASGGELSRILLALKIVLSEQNITIIFDEIDSGTGGATANSIGQKLKLLSKDNQVICITHTTQVAAFNDNHILVTKTVEDNHYNSKAIILDEENIIKELARMMSTEEINQESLSLAKTIRQNCK